MNSVGVKRKEKMTTVQVYLWILGLILVLEPFLSSWRQLGIVEAFEPMEYNVELVLLSPYWKMSFKIRSSCTRLLLVRIPSRKFVCNF